MARALLGLGANLGDRQQSLRQALRALAGQVRIDRVSSLYETEPIGYKNQTWFLNAVCEAETTLEPAVLLAVIKEIEQNLGRIEGPRFGPRTVDIDILFYDDLVLNIPALQIPHPRLTKRRFVLVPLAEIAPHLRHPQNDKTVQELLRDLPERNGVRLFQRDWTR